MLSLSDRLPHLVTEYRTPVDVAQRFNVVRSKWYGGIVDDNVRLAAFQEAQMAQSPGNALVELPSVARYGSRVHEQRTAESSDRTRSVTLLGVSLIPSRALWTSASFTHLVLLSRMLGPTTRLWRRAGTGRAVPESGHAEVECGLLINDEVSLLLERYVLGALCYKLSTSSSFCCSAHCVLPLIATGVASVR